MNILVTGCNGYIGSLLTRRLLQAGHQVTGVDVDAPSPVLYAIGQGRGHSFIYDVWDVQYFQKKPSMIHKQDVIIHLAAMRLGLCETNHRAAENINVRGTANTLKWADELGASRFIFASTCSVYGKTGPGEQATEETLPNPTTVYAETKLEAEELVLKSGIGMVFRFATVCGLSPNFRSDTLLNMVAHHTALGIPVTLYDREVWRPFSTINYVLGCLDGMLSLPNEAWEKGEGRVYNVVENNIQKKALAKWATEACDFYHEPANVTMQEGKDPRNYVVKMTAFPNHHIENAFMEVYRATRLGVL